MGAPEPPPRFGRGQTLSGYVAAGVAPAVVSAVLIPMQARLADSNLAMLLLLAVLGAAAGFGIGPGVVSALVAAAIYNLLFLEPRFSLEIAHPLDLVTFAVFLAVALATGWLAGQVRDHAQRVAAEAQATALLLEASRALARAASVDEAAQALADHLARSGAGSAVVLVRDGDGLRLAGAPAGVVALAPDSLAAAEAALVAGDRGAASAEWRFTPLEGLRSRVGVVGLRQGAARAEARLAYALIEQGGVVVERAALATTAAENDALREADRLRVGILNSISHDFRTPLASILGSATTLSEYEASLSPAVRRDLLSSIQQDARRLNAHVGALLDMGRLEGGALKPAREPLDVREVLGSVVRRLKPRLEGRKVEREFARRLSLVEADPTLLEQAVLNLVDNAARLTPEGGTIRLAAEEDARHVLIVVEDTGPGIPPAALAEVFDKFRRLGEAGDRGDGLGLGLSIAKGFVEAMGGRIAATSPLTPQGGARFVISLPKSIETSQDLL